jgi:hypothetical protein
VPVGVVVTLLGALQAAPVAVGVLAGVLGSVAVQVLVSGEKALVPLARLAVLVVPDKRREEKRVI